MFQEVKVAARTFEVNDTSSMNDDLTLLSGKAAGVCYMPDDYMETGIQNVERAMKRAAATAHSGHHSVYDHGHITFIIKTSKMMAMLLNSVGAYATSEKSARYTAMHPETERERELYVKWRERMKELIGSKYPYMPEKEADRLSIENARYMISVFVPTVMEYTVSFRQAFLIADYLEKLHDACGALTGSYHARIRESAGELAALFRFNLGETRLHDNKNQHFRFLEYQAARGWADPKKEVVGDSYTLTYTGSLAMLAQVQRHRTIRYSMCFDGDVSRYGFYVPVIVEGYGLGEEWTEDIKSVSDCIPQGTLVRITEQGIFEDFALKCKERLCGRAQLEVAKNTETSIQKFLRCRELLSDENKKLLMSMVQKVEKTDGIDGTAGYEACARCVFHDFTCTEGCRWGAKDALKRLI